MVMRKSVRILLVGDRSVGKTSLILSLVSEEFNEDVPPKAEEITIPADVTPEQVPTHIVDFSAVEQTEEQLIDEIQRAHVICVVYSVDDEDSLDHVTSHWLPLVRSSAHGSPLPVILVGNKVDLVDYSTIDMVMSIMEEYPEIESCVECSARTLKNISEMFYYAQKAVLHPTGPLYVLETQDLTEECKKALTRIFKICDLDNDGLLSDTELNVFQKRCFNAPLQPQVLEDVKAVLSKNINDGVQNNCITLKGFLFLHRLFIQRGRNETVWTVLRKFGYNDSLVVTKDYLIPSVRVPHGCTSELNHRGQHFLQKLFEKHDKDRDGALSFTEMSCLFSTCPTPPWHPDFKRTVVTNTRGWMTMQGFMSYWSLITLMDLPLALEHLGFLGYNIVENESHANAVHVTREKSLDLAKKQSSRNVYQCHVIGQQKSGKSSFCACHIGHTLDVKGKYMKRDASPPSLTVNSVLVYGQEKQLILREIEAKGMADPLMTEDTQCDVVCLVYDINHPKSFEYVAEIYLRYFEGSKIPVLVVANKSDLAPVRQDYILQPDEFCSRHKLAPPHLFSALPSPTGSSQHPDKDVYVKLATMAVFPRFQAAWVLFYRHRHLRQLTIMASDKEMWWRAGLGVAALTAIGFLISRLFRGEHR